MESNEWTDRFGSVASTVCALHCALCAFLPVVFSALGVGFLLGQGAEWFFSIVAILFGVGALAISWRQHRSKKVAALLIVGVVGIMASRGLEMGSDHHGHGDEAHQADEHSDEHADEHSDEHSDEHADEHDDSMHLMGTFVGVFAGLLLLFGHISNIRAARRCREESCD